MSEVVVVEINEAIGAQSGIMVLLDGLEGRSQEVSEFLDSAIEVAAIYGEDSPNVSALLKAGNLGPMIDHEINRLRVLIVTRTEQMIYARGKQK